MSETQPQKPQRGTEAERKNGLAYRYSRQQAAPQQVAYTYRRTREAVRPVYTRS